MDWYIRGQIISHTSYISKQWMSKLLKLSSDILSLDKKYADSPDPQLYKKRLALHTKFNPCPLIKLSSYFARQNKTEFGEKPSKLLALQLRQQKAQNLIFQINSPTGDILTNPTDINSCFSDYYFALYQSESNTDMLSLDSFSLQICWIVVIIDL